jgi:5-methylcytosine-specific restriction endonuclease McrA
MTAAVLVPDEHFPDGTPVTWFKIDDGFYDHNKVRKLRTDRNAAVGVWGLCGAWSANHLTDGFIPDEIVERYDQKHRLARRLVAVGLWEREELDGESGYRFHDWSDWQPVRSEVEDRRARFRDRKTLFRHGDITHAVRERDGCTCRYCGLPVKFTDRRGPRGGTYDHVTPRIYGGQTTVDNLVVACRECRDNKGDRTLDQAGLNLLEPRGSRSGPKSRARSTRLGSKAGSNSGSNSEVGDVSAYPTRPDQVDTEPPDGGSAAASGAAPSSRPTGGEVARAQSITRAYAEAVPFSNFAAVMGIVRKAIRSERYSDDAIQAALLRLAADGRPVTVDTLRTELDGLPAPRSRQSTTDQRVAEAQSLKERMRAKRPNPKAIDP